jgi:hypothetical protein
MGYTNKIETYENGYTIKNCKKYFFGYLVISSVLQFTIFLFFAVMCIHEMIKYKLQFNNLFTLCVLLLIVIIFFFIYKDLFNNTKNIYINTKEKKIIFSYEYLPVKRLKIINFNDIKEISVNYTPYTPSYGNIPMRNYTFEIIPKEKIYNLDIIDYDKNAYRIFRSTVYDAEFIDFSKKISEIINVNLNEQINTEGEKIYKKLFK